MHDRSGARDDARVGLRSCLGYGAGDFAFNLSYGTSLAYSVYFYTDICRIPAATVATLILVSRIINALVDPLIGVWIDRRGVGERVRPFILFGAIPLGGALFLSFIPIDASLAARTIWACATYLAVSILYSTVNVPYGVLMNLMTANAASRVRLATCRMLGANAGFALVGLATFGTVKFLGGADIERGFSLFGLAMGIVLVACLLFTWATTSERLRYAVDRVSPGVMLATVFRNPGWLAVTGAMTLATISATMTYGMATYYALYITGGGEVLAGRMIGMVTILSLVGTVFAPMLVRAIGIKGTAIAFNLLQVPPFLAMFAIHSSALALAMTGVIGFCIGVREPAVYTILSDAIDRGEGGHAGSSLGFGYALNSAFIKLALGLGGAMMGWLLAAGGYVGGSAIQTDGAKSAILTGFGLVPTLFACGAAALLWRYRFVGRPDGSGLAH